MCTLPAHLPKRYRPWRQPRRTIPRMSESWRRILPLLCSGIYHDDAGGDDFTKRYLHAESLYSGVGLSYCRRPPMIEVVVREENGGGRRRGGGEKRPREETRGRACRKSPRGQERRKCPLRPLSSFEVHERLRRTKRRRSGYSLPFLLSRGVLPFPVEARTGRESLHRPHLPLPLSSTMTVDDRQKERRTASRGAAREVGKKRTPYSPSSIGSEGVLPGISSNAGKRRLRVSRPTLPPPAVRWNVLLLLLLSFFFRYFFIFLDQFLRLAPSPGSPGLLQANRVHSLLIDFRECLVPLAARVQAWRPRIPRRAVLTRIAADNEDEKRHERNEIQGREHRNRGRDSRGVR